MIERQFNWLPEQRVDLPHLKSLESSAAFDADQIIGKALSGRKALVLRGLIIPVTNTAGAPAQNLLLNVASGLVLNYNFSESGTIFSVQDTQAPEQLIGTNPNIVGSFTSNITNYVGIDVLRNPDSSTSDTVQFLDVTTDEEIPEVVPLGRTLQYKIVISTQAFSTQPNLAPIAKVVTDSNNNVVSITDCRNLMFRLGSGGDAANALFTYPWGSRTENNIVYSGGADPFAGEDKSINNLSDWMDAIMTSLWEVRGGEHWYSNVNLYNVKLAYGEPVTLFGDNFAFDSGTNLLQWQSLLLIYENASDGTTYYNTLVDSSAIGGGTGLVILDGQCLYVDLQREANASVVPAVASLISLGGSVIPGRRIVIAWRKGSLVYTRDRPYEVGRSFPVATTTTLGVVKLSTDSTTPLSPIVISDGGGFINAANGVGGPGTTALTINGGNGASGFAGGQGIVLSGGDGGANGSGGRGGWFTAGDSHNANAPEGFLAVGGLVASGVGNGGTGLIGQAGAGAGGGTDGFGLLGLGVGGSAPGTAIQDTGVVGIGTGNGYGVFATGGTTGSAFSLVALGNGTSLPSGLAAPATGTAIVSQAETGGSGSGILAQGGDAGLGIGVIGFGGTGGGVGVAGFSISGVFAAIEGVNLGGSTGAGVTGAGGSGGGDGGIFTGGGPGAGVVGNGGSGGGHAVIGTATAGGNGGVFTGAIGITSTTNTSATTTAPQYGLQCNGGYVSMPSTTGPHYDVGFAAVPTLTPTNVVQYAANFTGRAGTGTITPNTGFNIGGGTITQSTNTITVVLPFTATTNNWVMHVTMESASLGGWINVPVVARTAGNSFTIQAQAPNNPGTAVSPSGMVFNVTAYNTRTASD